ncbi:uncharacterized protein LOC114652391 [Erpetoichthys calabaricus]|nr:uncharacterized protein LOC114652391 [Erpetoichthys calabaricus]
MKAFVSFIILVSACLSAATPSYRVRSQSSVSDENAVVFTYGRLLFSKSRQRPQIRYNNPALQGENQMTTHLYGWNEAHYWLRFWHPMLNRRPTTTMVAAAKPTARPGVITHRGDTSFWETWSTVTNKQASSGKENATRTTTIQTATMTSGLPEKRGDNIMGANTPEPNQNPHWTSQWSVLKVDMVTKTRDTHTPGSRSETENPRKSRTKTQTQRTWPAETRSGTKPDGSPSPAAATLGRSYDFTQNSTGVIPTEMSQTTQTAELTLLFTAVPFTTKFRSTLAFRGGPHLGGPTSSREPQIRGDNYLPLSYRSMAGDPRGVTTDWTDGLQSAIASQPGRSPKLTFEKQAINGSTGSARKKRNTSGNNIEKLGGLPSLKELLMGRALRGDSESVEAGGVVQRRRRRRGLAPSLRPEIQRREFMNRNGDLIDLLKTAESLEIAKIKVDQDFKMDSNPPEYDAPGDSWEQYFNDNNEYQVDEFINPCENYHCPRGKVCAVSKDNKPKCICQDPSTCLQPAGQAELVCGTDNQTYESSCHLFTAKCFSEGAQRRPGLHLDYLGACRYIAPCQDHELAQFSLHIKNWLKEVLVHLYEYDLKNPGFLTKKQRIIVKKIYDLQRQLKVGTYTSSWRRSTFETNYLMHVYPVHWQFGQLDQKPADGYLSHSELAPLRTSLIPMDHCTSRFFRECDLNRDRRVSLKEWCSCFGTRNEIDLLF